MKPATAFSEIAPTYDSTFTETAIGRLQRLLVWQNLETTVHGTPRVLEVNCGTGADAIWMGQKAWQVLATDIAPQMVSKATEKVQQSGLERQVETRVCASEDLAQLPESGFDLILSNFGGLNCVAPEQLHGVCATMWRKLNPGGKICLVVMGRFCWWETVYFLLKRKPAEACRRWKKGPVNARLNAENTVPTWYYSPRQLRQHFPVKKRQAHTFPIGFWLPPSYLDPFFYNKSKVLQRLFWLDQHAAPGWTAAAADHYLICITKPAL